MDNSRSLVTAGTEVVLDLALRKIRRTEFGRTWLRKLDHSVGTIEAIDAEHSQILSVRLPMGKIPRLGAPRRLSGGISVYPVPAGVEICSYSHHDGKVRFAKIAGLAHAKSRQCAVAITVRKRTIEVANTAGLAVFDSATGRLVSRSVSECVGRLLPSIRQVPIRGKHFCRDLGWWYGVLVADGWLEPSMVGYAKNNPEKRAEFVRIARELISNDFTLNEYFDDGSSPGKFGASVKLHLYGPSLRQKIFDPYCPRGDGRGALYKRLPAVLFSQASRECLLGIFAGLLEGDSTLTWSHSKKRPQAVCCSHTSSVCLVRDLQQLGGLLGIRTTLTTTPARGRSQESYTLGWSLPDVVRVSARTAICQRGGPTVASGVPTVAADEGPY